MNKKILASTLVGVMALTPKTMSAQSLEKMQWFNAPEEYVIENGSLQKVYENLQNAFESINALGLVPNALF